MLDTNETPAAAESTEVADVCSTPLTAAPGSASTTIELLAATDGSYGARDLAGFASAAAALRWLTTDAWHGRLLRLETADDGSVYAVDACSDEPVARLVEHRIVRTTGRIGGGSCCACSCGVIIRSSSLAALRLDFATHCQGVVLALRPQPDEKMTLAEARAELAAVGATVKLWTGNGLTTLYVNGADRRKLGEIWVGSCGCDAHRVWAAVAAVVADSARQQESA